MPKVPEDLLYIVYNVYSCIFFAEEWGNTFRKDFVMNSQLGDAPAPRTSIENWQVHLNEVNMSPSAIPAGLYYIQVCVGQSVEPEKNIGTNMHQQLWKL